MPILEVEGQALLMQARFHAPSTRPMNSAVPESATVRKVLRIRGVYHQRRRVFMGLGAMAVMYMD
jgi:hypothetical protein